MSQTELPTVAFVPFLEHSVPVVEGFVGVPDYPCTTPPRYTYKQFLAHGASGHTFEVIRTEDNVSCALKVSCTDNLSPVERLSQKSEVACMRAVNHFACVRLLEFVISNRVLFLVMEYCDAGDLSYQIRTMRNRHLSTRDRQHGLVTTSESTGGATRTLQCPGFDEDTLKYVLLQLLLGLHHMHTHCHMLHRDLKPRNVLATTTGLLKIGDFGFSKSYDTMKDDIAHTFCGTPSYIAPEVWLKRPYGRPADMWSLGIVLYECMTTTVPFSSQNMEQLRRSILEEDPQPVKVGCYSAELNHIVVSLLNKQPAERPDTTALLNTPYMRAALATFRDALRECPIVDSVMEQAQAALQPEPVYHVDTTVAFDSPVRKFKARTGEWVPRHLVLRNGEVRLERARRRQTSDASGSVPLGNATSTSGAQSGRRSMDSSRNSTLSNLILPLPGVASPNVEPALLTGPTSSFITVACSPAVCSTASNDSALGSPTTTNHTHCNGHHADDSTAFIAIPHESAFPKNTMPMQAIRSPQPPLPQASKNDLSAFKVTAIEDLQVLGESSLTLRLANNQFVFFDTEQAVHWEHALRRCLGWPPRQTPK